MWTKRRADPARLNGSASGRIELGQGKIKPTWFGQSLFLCQVSRSRCLLLLLPRHFAHRNNFNSRPSYWLSGEFLKLLGLAFARFTSVRTEPITFLRRHRPLSRFMTRQANESARFPAKRQERALQLFTGNRLMWIATDMWPFPIAARMPSKSMRQPVRSAPPLLSPGQS